MRTLTAAMQMSLDGYVAGPNGELDWIFANMNAGLQDCTLEYLSGLDTMLMGRVSYLGQAEAWPTRTGPLAAAVNGHTKIVFTQTLRSADWTNSRIATGSAAEEIAQLQRQPGKPIGVAGGATFVQTLLKEQLVDQLRLTIHPVVLGGGLRLFTKPVALKLLEATTFDTGSVVHTYQVATTAGRGES